SGLLSAVPVLATILAVFSQAAMGPSAAIRLLRGMVGGFYALATFCFVLTFALTHWGIARGFMVALLGAIVAHVISLKLQPRHAPTAPVLDGIAVDPDACVPKPP